MRSKQRTKDRVGPLKDTLGNVVVEEDVAANLLNAYFASVFTVGDTSNIPNLTPSFQGSVENQGLLGIKIRKAMVQMKLASLKVDMPWLGWYTS